MRAYAFHVRNSRSVPGSDVRVEGSRPVKRLRADPRALKELTYYGVGKAYSRNE
jgi:hypothetical protein